jgi:C4-dicarboxylate-specific signal transduction histidine kinase
MTNNSNELMDALFEHVPCTISVITSDLKYLEVNKKLQETFHQKKGDMLGNNLGAFTKESEFITFARDLFKSNEDTLIREVKTLMENKFFLIKGKKIANGTQAILMGLDITELKEMQQQTMLNEKLITMGELSAGIIHEINNPLTVIKSAGSILGKSCQDQPKAIKMLTALDKATSMMESIITSLKRFSHSGNVENQKVSLKAILDQSLLITRGKCKQNSVLIETNICETEVVGNEVKLTQVFINLINNSIDAMKDLPKKTIRIECIEKDSHIQLVFRDAGEGIPADIANQIFNKFYSTKEVGKGTGLGLAICRQIIEEHNGTLDLDMNQKNTTFVIDFPKN